VHAKYTAEILKLAGGSIDIRAPTPTTTDADTQGTQGRRSVPGAGPLGRRLVARPVIWHPLRVTRKVEPRPSLSERLSRAGILPDADPVITWVRLREVEGRRATVIDVYRLVSEPRGLEPVGCKY